MSPVDGRGRRVAVGVPVWHGEAFVAETLASVLAQSHDDFRVLVSIDGPDAASVEACRPFTDDDRVRLVVQPRRLGWVANTAAVFALALEEGADFACVQPHDDLIEPDYLTSLLAAHDAKPDAAVTFSDMAIMGGNAHSFQASVEGPAYRRMMTLLTSHYPAVAWRGLVRAEALRAVAPVRGNAYGDFAIDTIWMTRLATRGGLVRVPRQLYVKRYHAGNTHAAWEGWSRQRKVQAWRDHCLAMLAEALSVVTGFSERLNLARAARMRLLHDGVALPPYEAEIAALDANERSRLAADFDRDVRALLGRA